MNPGAETSSSTVPGWRVWLTAAGLALLLFVVTADHGVQWQDSGWQQYRIATGQIEHPSGLVLYHPLHYYLGRGLVLTGLFEPAWAVTLLSCLAGAVAVANVTVLVGRWTGSVLAAAFTGLTLGLGHTFWQHATHTETYALVAALLSSEWLLWSAVLRRDRVGLLPWIGLVNGLGVANHLLAALVLPVNLVAAIVVIARRRCWWVLPVAAGAWLLGTLPYSLLILAEWRASGDLAGTLASALWGKYGEDVLNPVPRARLLAMSIAYIVYNFPGLGLPLAAWGALRSPVLSRFLGRLLLAELLIYLVFVLRYPIPDQYTFFVPAYALIAVLAGFGLHALVGTWRRWLVPAALVTACWTPLVYVGAAETLRANGLLLQAAGTRPYRDGYRAFLLPWGVGDDSVARLNRHLFELTGPDGFVVLDAAMTRHAILYDQFRGRGPAGVTFMLSKTIRTTHTPEEARALLAGHLRAGRAVVQVPYRRDEPAEVAPGAVWTRSGDLYVLERLDHQ